MLRTKHAVMSFIILAFVLLGLAVYLLLIEDDAPESASLSEEPEFVEEGKDPGVVEQEPLDREAAREALIQKLSDYEDDQADTGAIEREAERDALSAEDGPLADSTLPTSTTEATDSESATSSLPTMSIKIGEIVQTGTPGSYCWNGDCRSVLATDLPQSAQSVSASSTISFSIEAENEPESVHVFFREINGTSTVISRALAPQEEAQNAIVLPDVRGEYLLLITGQWLGGNEVSNIFKILIL